MSKQHHKKIQPVPFWTWQKTAAMQPHKTPGAFGKKRVKSVQGTFATRTLQQLAASTLGKMGLGKKKTMTPAAMEARRKNGFQPKRTRERMKLAK